MAQQRWLVRAVVVAGGLVASALVGCESSPASTTTADAATQADSADDSASVEDTAVEDSTTADASGKDSQATDVAFGAPCTSVAKQLLGPIDEVSTGKVTVLKEEGQTRTLYVDASAGGYSAQASHPRLYLNLETAKQVELTDLEAVGSSAWDLALKRPVLYTNGGTGGPGQGQAGFVFKGIDSVTEADEADADLQAEAFWDSECEPALDPIGSVLTTMSDWYDYQDGVSALTPKNITFVIVGGTGKHYKVQILDYYANPDGSKGQTSGRYVLKVAPL